MKEYLQKLITEPLSGDDTAAVFRMLVSDQSITDAQIGAYLCGSSIRPMTSHQIVGAVTALREVMTPVNVSELENDVLIDIVGTGGSGLNPFNTSTAASFVCAGFGVKVAKHGNRAATSKSGSADVLEHLGATLTLSPQKCIEYLKSSGFCFLFAPQHHAATKRVALLRKEVGFRTIFNLLGPMLNPARVNRQVIGVSQSEMLPIVAKAIEKLGAKHTLVVRGKDGLDECTLVAETEVYEIRAGQPTTYYTINPTDFGMSLVEPSSIQGFEPEKSAEKIRAILGGEQGAYRDLVVLNAALGLYVAGKSTNFKDAVTQAQASLDSGKALASLNRYVGA